MLWLSASTSATASVKRKDAKAYKVKGGKLDDVFQELGIYRISLMKIDVEGAEFEVLLGAANTLKAISQSL